MFPNVLTRARERLSDQKIVSSNPGKEHTIA